MSKRVLIAQIVGLLVTTTLSSVYATADDLVFPPPIPGWTHADTPLAGDTSEHHGVILPGNAVQYSSPVVAEVDGDSSDGLETVVASSDGMVTVVKQDGSILWSAQVPTYACGGANSTNNTFSSPAVGTIYGDGVPYVVIGYGGMGLSCDGGVIAFNGPTGQIKWNFSTKNFSQTQHFWTNAHAVYSTPALADVDGTGKMVVGFGSFDRNVYLLNFDGSVRWYYNAADTSWSSPVFTTIGSKPVMIIGTDISQNKIIRPATANGGYLYAFYTTPRKNIHINFRDHSAYAWQTYFNQTIYSAPVVADVLPSPGNEVIVGSGCFFPQSSKNKNGKWVKILRLKDGKVLQTLKTTGCLTSTPAVGDIEGTGHLDIVATVNGSTSIGGDGFSRITAWRPQNPTPLWSVIPFDRGGNDANGGNFMSPILADIDGNGSLEVLAANETSVVVLNGADGHALTCQQHNCSDTLLDLYASAPLKSTPAIIDINGKLGVVIAGGHSDTHRGVLYGWTGFENLLKSDAGNQAAYSAPWPMYRENAHRSPVFGQL